MLDCLADLILRPGINPPVQIGLTVVAGVDTLTGGDEPGEVDGHPVPAVLVRELAYTLGLLPRPEPSPTTAAEPDDRAGPSAATTRSRADARGRARRGDDRDGRARRPAEPDDRARARSGRARGGGGPRREPDPGGSDGGRARLGELLGLRTLAGTALTHLPAIAIVEEISGQLLALTDATQIRHTATCGRPRCRTGKRPCDHPPAGRRPRPTTGHPGYSPSVPLARFVRARDRRCRFPGCRAAAIRCDLDHNTPWPAGATSADNLCCLCRHHHRLSHQAPGWTMTRLPDGGLQWTTPGGDSITTHPPRYGSDDDLPPPTDRPAHRRHRRPRHHGHGRSPSSNNSAAGHRHHRPRRNPHRSECIRGAYHDRDDRSLCVRVATQREKPRRSIDLRGSPGTTGDTLTVRSGAHDLAGADARGARVDPATVAGGDERPHGLDVRVPTARRAAVRVRHRHTETGALATHIAHGSHG